MYVNRWRYANCDQPGRHYDGLIKVYKTYYNVPSLKTRKSLGLHPPVLMSGATLHQFKKRKMRRLGTCPEPATRHKGRGQKFDRLKPDGTAGYSATLRYKLFGGLTSTVDRL